MCKKYVIDLTEPRIQSRGPLSDRLSTSVCCICILLVQVAAGGSSARQFSIERVKRRQARFECFQLGVSKFRRARCKMYFPGRKAGGIQRVLLLLPPQDIHFPCKHHVCHLARYLGRTRTTIRSFWVDNRSSIPGDHVQTHTAPPPHLTPPTMGVLTSFSST